MADLSKKPIFAFSAYAYVVVKPLEHEDDLENTNLPTMPWAPGCALFPFRRIPTGNGDSTWLDLGQASKMGNSMGASGASVRSDCVIKTIALNGHEKFLRFDIYFGIDADNKTVPTQNRSFQNSSLTPDNLNAINLVLPIRSEIIEGRIEMNIDNGQIERSFQIPKQTTFGQSATSVATNGNFIPLDWSPTIRADFEKSEKIRLKKMADEADFLKTGRWLELKVNGDTTKDRAISDEQKILFIDLLKRYPKTPIRVFTWGWDTNGETIKYARKIEQLLQSAGYGGGDIIPIGSTNSDLKSLFSSNALVFLTFGSPTNWQDTFMPVGTPFNDIKPVISSGLTNDANMFHRGILNCVKWGFSGIGLEGNFSMDDRVLKSSEVGIIVLPKNR
jgi:hypothetical protein